MSRAGGVSRAALAGLCAAIVGCGLVAGCGGSGSGGSGSGSGGFGSGGSGSGGFGSGGSRSGHRSPPRRSTPAAPTTTSSSTTGTAGRHRHRGSATTPPPIGTTQALSAFGSTLHATVTRLIDPLDYRGDSVVPGTRPVAVQVRIAVLSGATYDSTASGDWSLELSPAAPAATPLDVKSGVCETPPVDFESSVVSGDVRPGCVAFSVPRQARIAAIAFAPHADAAHAVRWR